MVIFHSYVSLPEGILIFLGCTVAHPKFRPISWVWKYPSDFMVNDPFPSFSPFFGCHVRQTPRKSLDRNLCGLVSGTLARGNNPTCQSCWWKMFHHLPKKWPKCRHIKPNIWYIYIYIIIPLYGASGTSSSEFRTPPKKRIEGQKKPAVNASTAPSPAFRFRSAVTQDWFASETSPSDWEVVRGDPGGTPKNGPAMILRMQTVFFLGSSWGFFIVGYGLTATVINMIFTRCSGDGQKSAGIHTHTHYKQSERVNVGWLWPLRGVSLAAGGWVFPVISPQPIQ